MGVDNAGLARFRFLGKFRLGHVRYDKDRFSLGYVGQVRLGYLGFG